MTFIWIMVFMFWTIFVSAILYSVALKLHDWWEARRPRPFRGFRNIHFRVPHRDGLYSFDVSFSGPEPHKLTDRLKFWRRTPRLPTVSVLLSIIPGPFDTRKPTNVMSVQLIPCAGGYAKMTSMGANYEAGKTCPAPTVTGEEIEEMAKPLAELVDSQLRECLTAQGYQEQKFLV